MEINFDEIPSKVEIAQEIPKQEPTVTEELDLCRQLLEERTTRCRPIKPIYKRPKRKPLTYTYKYFCICPKIAHKHPHLCKHTGNIIIDRDVLTKEEHICYLAAPKERPPLPRRYNPPRFYQKKAVVPDCTSRIEALAQPDLKRVHATLKCYKNTLSKRQYQALRNQIAKKPEVQHTSIEQALSYLEEEKRLQRVARVLEKRRCNRMKKNIVKKQRKQIKKIICVLFEEMKDFLLNDQFLIDERSTLCAVILEQIRLFTEKEFYTTSNLREYQQILANNLTVWINKFISNLNIHVSPPQPRVERPEPEMFLPVTDYISVSEECEEEICPEEEDDYLEMGEAELELDVDMEQGTEDTLKNTNL